MLGFFKNYFHSCSDFRTVSSSQRRWSSWRLMESILYECANTSPPCQTLSAPQWHAGERKRLGVEAHPALMDEVRPSSIVHTRLAFVNLKAFVIIIPGTRVWWWPTTHGSHIKMENNSQHWGQETSLTFTKQILYTLRMNRKYRL